MATRLRHYVMVDGKRKMHTGMKQDCEICFLEAVEPFLQGMMTVGIATMLVLPGRNTADLIRAVMNEAL